MDCERVAVQRLGVMVPGFVVKSKSWRCQGIHQVLVHICIRVYQFSIIICKHYHQGNLGGKAGKQGFQGNGFSVPFPCIEGIYSGKVLIPVN